MMIIENYKRLLLHPFTVSLIYWILRQRPDQLSRKFYHIYLLISHLS